MLNFFRKIRKKLAADNKFGRYTRYAIGEVVLIMLGIFMALQLQNWNEKRKQEATFKNNLELIYNAIDRDLSNMENSSYFLLRQIELGQAILRDPDSIPIDKLPEVLGYFDTNPELFKSETSYFFSQLIPDANNISQAELAQEISNYISWVNSQTETDPAKLSIRDHLFDNGLPTPRSVFGFNEIQNFSVSSTMSANTTNELKLARSLVEDSLFKHSLRQVLSHKYIQLFSYTNQEDANSIKKRIEEYHPDVKLLYRDIGMIGDAVGSWTTSTPMTLVNEELSIWEYIGVLKDGGLKFRTRDSWNQNWGLSTFDNKHALYFGKNIPVKAGRYKVTLNLSERTYKLIKLDD